MLNDPVVTQAVTFCTSRINISSEAEVELE